MESKKILTKNQLNALARGRATSDDEEF